MKKNFATLFLLMAGFAFLNSLSVLAQDQSSAPQHTEALSPFCVAIGAVISIVVSLLKRITFVKDNPKLVATILSGLASAIGYFFDVQHGIGQIIVCTAIQLAGAIASYELAIKPLSKPTQSL